MAVHCRGATSQSVIALARDHALPHLHDNATDPDASDITAFA